MTLIDTVFLVEVQGLGGDSSLGNGVKWFLEKDPVMEGRQYNPHRSFKVD